MSDGEHTPITLDDEHLFITSDDEHLSYRALAARHLVKESVEEAKEQFRDLIPYLGGPYLGAKPPISDTSKPLPVCIIGAGIAGLRIAMFLEKAGVEYHLLEASDRHGGRVMTHHFTGAENDYFDVGAMRYPRIRALKLTFKLFDELGLTAVGKIIPYIMSTDNNFRLFNSMSLVISQVETHITNVLFIDHKTTVAKLEARTEDDPYTDARYVSNQDNRIKIAEKNRIFILILY